MIVVLDEDIPRAFKGALEKIGFEVFDSRDHGFRGASDEAIFNFAVQKRALLLTADLGYTKPLRFNLRQLAGLTINRLPETLTLATRLNELKQLLTSISFDELAGCITVLMPGRIRRRQIR